MKKKFMFLPFDVGRLKKVWIMSKITIFLVLLGLTTSYGNVLSQNDYKVNLHLKDASLLDVLLEIEKQTSFMFMYKRQDVENVGKLSIDISGDDVGKILNECLNGTGLTYEVRENVVVIKPKPYQREELKRVTLKGKVVDVDKNPIPGVAVVLKGTTVGVSTNEKGEYSLTVPESEDIILVFTFMGMKKEEVKFLENPIINVILIEDELELDDVVITGYGNIKKSSFTGTATHVKKEDILKVGSSNVIDILQVFDPSLRIMKNNEMGSDPNTLPEFYIRGRSGIAGVKELDKHLSEDISEFALTNNPNLPVFILDGFEVGVERVYDFDINRIKDITILKDAAATAIYGSRASNGVVVIETFPPKPGEIILSYNGNYAITTPDLTSYNLMNAKEKLEAEVASGLFQPWNNSPYETPEQEARNLEYYYLKKLNQILIGVDNYWLSQPLNTGFNHRHSVYLEGGSNEIRFGVEMRYDNQNGVMKKSYRDRVGAGMVLDYRHKNLQVKNHVTYDIIRAKDSPYGNFSDYAEKHPYDSWKDENGEYLMHLPQWYSSQPLEVNPFYEATIGSFSKNGYSELINNFSVNYNITSYFFIRGQFAISTKDSWSKLFTSPSSVIYRRGGGTMDLFEKGELTETSSKVNSINFKILASYNRQIEDHNINVHANVELKTMNSKYSNAHYRGFSDSDRNTPAYAYEIVRKPTFTDNETRLLGIFTTLNYSFNNIYLLDASIRFDGSSEFGTDKKWAPFWSLGTGVNFHNYSFMRSVTWLDSFRLTGNVGETGKTNFQPFVAKNTFQIHFDEWYPTGIASTLKYMGNENLTWEKQTSWNARAEFSIFKKMTFKFDFYHKKTKDLVTEVSLPTSAGFPRYTDNVGEILNKGFEMDLTLNVFHNQDWNIILSGNLAHNKNKILKISESLKEYNERVDDFYSKLLTYNPDASVSFLMMMLDENRQYAKSYMKYEEGSSLTGIYAMKSLGINPANGKEVFIKRDGTITYDWLSSEQQKVGDTEPWAQGSFSLNVRFKNISLYTTFLYEWGGEAYNHTIANQIENANLIYRNADRRVLTDRWQNIGDRTPLKSITERYYTTRPTSRFVQKNNSLTFNSLSLSYDFNRELLRKIKLTTLKLQFNLNDIATWSTVKQERGTAYPYARTFTFSLNTTF